MVEETRDMIKNGADGIVFGCLDAYGNIDTEQSGHITALAKVNHKQVVFHRAFDYVKDPFKAIETLINMGVDRVLTPRHLRERKSYGNYRSVMAIESKYSPDAV